MHYTTPLITTIVGGLVLAFLLGMIANHLHISPLVGYLLAGVLAGPFNAGLCSRYQPSAGAGRHPADVRCWPALFPEGSYGGEEHRHSQHRGANHHRHTAEIGLST